MFSVFIVTESGKTVALSQIGCKITTKIAHTQVFAHFFLLGEIHFAIIKEPEGTTWSMQPLENGVPQRPFRPQAQAADTTVFTGLILT